MNGEIEDIMLRVYALAAWTHEYTVMQYIVLRCVSGPNIKYSIYTEHVQGTERIAKYYVTFNHILYLYVLDQYHTI